MSYWIALPFNLKHAHFSLGQQFSLNLSTLLCRKGLYLSNSGKIQFGYWQKFSVLLEIHPIKWISHFWVWMQTAKSSANINLPLYMSIKSRKANLFSLSPRQHTVVTVFLAGSFPTLVWDYILLYASMW